MGLSLPTTVTSGHLDGLAGLAVIFSVSFYQKLNNQMMCQIAVHLKLVYFSIFLPVISSETQGLNRVPLLPVFSCAVACLYIDHSNLTLCVRESIEFMPQ